MDSRIKAGWRLLEMPRMLKSNKVVVETKWLSYDLVYVLYATNIWLVRRGTVMTIWPSTGS